MNRFKVSLFVISVILLFTSLAGCSLKSEEQVLEETQEVAINTFQQESVDTNTELENFSLYLPGGFEITEETMSNLILQRDDQTYILFYNALEDTTSELNYKAAESIDESTLLESFEDENRFGYIKVLSTEEDSYELQIGVGGVKITTRTSKDQLVEDTEEMMKMANSIAYTKQD
ncbi:hypothetical protein GH741_08975 [Aquibacillus halophilus]|uniref:Uncharacterized protein n=1 Tax=Aquibacillus halophilus TaxID=930132 RepID=A0A6A8DE77_9BACI|nr:hypothetical protein [Aquibacillus halophilus]MRH42816.1 hypothetical protein [Aquibacillus halophilus]